MVYQKASAAIHDSVNIIGTLVMNSNYNSKNNNNIMRWHSLRYTELESFQTSTEKNQDYASLLPVMLSVFIGGPDEAREDNTSSCDVDVIVTSVVVKLPA